MKWIRRNAVAIIYYSIIVFMLWITYLSIKKSQKSGKAKQRSTYKFISVPNEAESEYMERIYYFDSLDSFMP